MNDTYTRIPHLPSHLRCPMCWHALVDHDTRDWSDFYSPVTCFSCNCSVSDPDTLQRIANARNDRPD